MADVGTLATAHYRQQQLITLRTTRALEALWLELGTNDVVASWYVLANRAAQLVAAGQYAAALAAIAYIRASMTEQGANPEPLALIDPRGLTGVTTDRRPLTSLLIGGVFRVRQLLAAGAPLDVAMLSGKSRFVLAGSNEVTQAGISASSASIGVTPTVTKYVRHLVMPSCARCIVLAGRIYPDNAGFRRHPRCDCQHVPLRDAKAADGLVTHPEGAFASLTRAQQDKTLGAAGAAAVRDGANLGRITNARLTTYVPSGRHGTRLTPTTRTVEDCLRIAGGNRDRFVQLLDESGYLR